MFWCNNDKCHLLPRAAPICTLFSREKKLYLRHQSVHKRMTIFTATITTFHIHVCSVTDRRQQGLPTDSHGTNTHFAWPGSTPVQCHTMRDKYAQLINYLSYLKMALKLHRDFPAIKISSSVPQNTKSLYSDKIILIGHADINRIYRLRIKDSRKQRII